MNIKYFTLPPLALIIGCQSNVDNPPARKIEYPATAKQDKVDLYFNTEIKDSYYWLEDENSEETKSWVAAQNKLTQDYLSQISYKDEIKDRLEELWNYPKYSTPFEGGEYYFYYKNDGLQNQAVLYRQKGLDGEPEVFLDPNKMSDEGTVSISTTSVSNDGKYFGYGLSEGGSDWKKFYVIDMETKEQLSDTIEYVKFSGMSWYKDGFFYTRYPEPEAGKDLSSQNENAKIYYHKIGTRQNEDKLIYEDPKEPKLGFYAGVTEDERFLELYISSGASNDNALYVKDLTKSNSQFVPIVKEIKNSYNLIDNIGDKLVVATNKDAPKYRIVLIDINKPEPKNWETLIPEKEEVLSSISSAGGKLFAHYMVDVASKIYVYDMEGNQESEVQLPTVGNVSGFEGKKDAEFVFYRFTSYTYPGTTYKYNIATKTSEVFKESEAKFNPQDYETKQVFYSSKDGTKIPMFITYKKGLQLNGQNPTVLYGYGGFNISITPSFSIANIVLLENGGVYAVANLRGGSEYGEEWHKSGMLDKKQNVFDDFISAAEYLVNNKYTNSEKLAISGRSNGGLLVGAAMTQRPELFQVALPAVGVLDMLKFHKYTIGHAWVSEYGSSEDSVQFENLLKYSPLHNIEETAYPATMVITADHDDRVVPAHSYKFISTLQEKQQGDNPVLIRIETMAGHGSGKPTSKIIEEYADVWAFVFYNMGIEPIYKHKQEM